MPADTRAYLGHASLTPLWDGVRGRLERNGLRVAGVVAVDLDEAGMERLGGLLGRRVARPSRLRLQDLDGALRRSAASAGLVAVVGTLTGPLDDRKAARAAKADARAGTAAQLDVALADAGLADLSWVPEFVDGVRLAGLLTRAGGGAATAIAHAGAVLAELAGAGTLIPSARPDAVPGSTDLGSGLRAGWGLAELATRCTGDAHGLDPGKVAAALVLRAAAAALGERVPESAGDARALWSKLGVVPDELSGTVLAWSLRPPGDDPWSTMMRARADLGLVTHLTLHELRGPAAGVQWAADGALVSVCENPQVLQAAARAGAGGALVCTSGNPASVGWLLIRGLVDQGVRVRYHGDFDWSGVAIAGRLLAAGVEPWRLGASDYEVAIASASSVDRVPLTGRRVETPWDPRLAVSMAHAGVAVHEEALLDVLLSDLTQVSQVRAAERTGIVG
ncbi:hypothetical protein GCM10009719_33350 [Nocardioides kribbensis]